MCLTKRDKFVYQFFSTWLNDHCGDWDNLLSYLDRNDEIFETQIKNWFKIKSLISDFVGMLLDYTYKSEQSLLAFRYECLEQFISELKIQKQKYLLNIPEIESYPNYCVDDVRQDVYAVYNGFFSIVRQIVLIGNMQGDSFEKYQCVYEKTSDLILEYKCKCDIRKLESEFQKTNKLINNDINKKVGLLKDFVDQFLGWHKCKLFAFNQSVFPTVYVSMDELLSDLDFQYNLLESKSCCLKFDYPKAIEYTIQEVQCYWDSFKVFYEKTIGCFQRLWSPIDGDPIGVRSYFLSGNIPELINSLRSVFSDIPYLIYKKEGMQESHFHIAVQSMFKVLGLMPKSEQATNDGRMDMVVDGTEIDERDGFSKPVRYIFEFKISESENLSQDAVEQIKEKDYGLSCKNDYYKVYGIGLCFDTKKKNIYDKYVKVLLYKNGKKQF